MSAAALVAAAVLPWSAGAAGAAEPGFEFTGAATAFGVQTSVNSSPEPSQVSDLVNPQVPLTNTSLDSFGSSEAIGKLASGGGAEIIPGLICLAAAQLCAPFPRDVFPPQNPAEARALHPTKPDASAPAAGGQAPTAFSSGGNAAAFGNATSHADAGRAETTATAGSTAAAGGATGSRSSTSRSTNVVDKGALVSRAESVVSGISLGGGAMGIAVDSVTVVTQVRYPPTGKPVETSTVTVQGASVGGNPAVIDGDGIRVTGITVPVAPGALTGPISGGTQAALDELNKALSAFLAASHVSIRTVGATSADSPAGRATTAQGLLVSFDGTPRGIPNLTTPDVPGCQSPFPSGVPNPCAGVSQDLNARYFGTVLYGGAGTQSVAKPQESFDFDSFPSLPDVPFDPTTGTGPAGVDPSARTTPSTTPSTTAAAAPAGAPAGGDPGAGAPGAPAGAPVAAAAAGPAPLVGSLPGLADGAAGAGAGDGGDPALAGADATAAPGGAQSPPLSRAASLFDPLAGSSGRLVLLFPALILGTIGVLAGRLRGAPARLPAAR